MSNEQAEPDVYQQNYIESLRLELVRTVEKQLSPVAVRYGYSKFQLEDKIKWQPIVLIVGNYSSGKSTLINELLGKPVQLTGQAPTDDAFTVISGQQEAKPEEQRDGMVLLHDNHFPFQHLQRHGQRFASHFKLKRIHSPLLKSLAIIDTPGMLDSVSEKDRGYDYQEVLADLAGLADLILVLFDPHKAGTVRETYESLRKTLPRATFEDRIRFVLNRVDECANLNDLLRVYGTLSWNLSQMMGRKDMPPIYMCYSEENREKAQNNAAFLPLLTNQREELKEAVAGAPKQRLDHLVSFIETHGGRLKILLTALQTYAYRRKVFLSKLHIFSATTSLLAIVVLYFTRSLEALASTEFEFAILGLAFLTLWLVLFFLLQFAFLPTFHRRKIKKLANLVRLDGVDDRDNWEHVEDLVAKCLEEGSDKLNSRLIRRDLKQLRKAVKKSSQEGRAALHS